MNTTGRRCQFSFERVSFELKWLTQLVNHIAHSAFFVWPLVSHLRAMKAANASGAGLDRNRVVYKRLASRALTATILSTLFTGSCESLFKAVQFVYQRNTEQLWQELDAHELTSACVVLH
eukprot:5874-Heterococcus_DN1.PRE.3